MNGKTRDDFEVWASAEHMNLAVCHGSQPDVVYLMAETNFTWRAWQASRESLVIELPPVRPEPTSSGDALQSDGEAATWNIWVGDKLAKKECREAIEAAGLKVAP